MKKHVTTGRKICNELHDTGTAEQLNLSSPVARAIVKMLAERDVSGYWVQSLFVSRGESVVSAVCARAELSGGVGCGLSSWR